MSRGFFRFLPIACCWQKKGGCLFLKMYYTVIVWFYKQGSRHLSDMGYDNREEVDRLAREAEKHGSSLFDRHAAGV